jgi:hypothetical protein
MKRRDFRAAAPGKIAQFPGETTYQALVNHAGFDLEDEQAFLAVFGERIRDDAIPELEAAWQKFSTAKRAFVKSHVDAAKASASVAGATVVTIASSPVATIVAGTQAAAKLPSNHLGADKRDAATVGQSPQAFSQTTEGPSMKTHEQRSHHRYMIGDKLRAAGDHMEAIGMHSKEEHRAFHRKEAERDMDGAMHLARMINESVAEGHEDAPADATLTAGMIRSAPESLKTDSGYAALSAKWEACQRTALPHAAQTFRQAAELLKAATPEDLITQFRAQEDVVAAHKRLLSQNRAADKDKEAAERAALVKSLVDGSVGLSPARECEMLGVDPTDPERKRKMVDQHGRIVGPWSIERIRKYEAQIAGNMPEVQVRAAPIASADGGAAPQHFAGNAPGPAARDNAGQGAAGEMEAALADARKRMKISGKNAESTAQYQRR